MVCIVAPSSTAVEKDLSNLHLRLNVEYMHRMQAGRPAKHTTTCAPCNNNNINSRIMLQDLTGVAAEEEQKLRKELNASFDAVMERCDEAAAAHLLLVAGSGHHLAEAYLSLLHEGSFVPSIPLDYYSAYMYAQSARHWLRAEAQRGDSLAGVCYELLFTSREPLLQEEVAFLGQRAALAAATATAPATKTAPASTSTSTSIPGIDVIIAEPIPVENVVVFERPCLARACSEVTQCENWPQPVPFVFEHKAAAGLSSFSCSD